MDARRRLASLVLESGWTIASAARELGVSRPTAYEWVARARRDGLVGMCEVSRRPERIARATSADVVARVLEVAAQYPRWGPKTLYPLMWPGGSAPVCERTVARILARANRRVQPPDPHPKVVQRFERPNPNDLWQTDYKRLGHHRARKDSLSVLDDCGRFCIALQVVPDQTLESAWSVLWEAFAEFGLPAQMLSDNGTAFKSNATWRWSTFDLRLMLLGIQPSHGRPYHPQTQGKVERFHGTIEREILFEKQSDIQAELDEFRNLYNWVRPHQALGMKTPGSIYEPSTRKRPSTMPQPFFPEGAILRKCQSHGTFSYNGIYYRMGRAFEGLPIGIRVQDPEPPKLVWGHFILGSLQDFKV